MTDLAPQIDERRLAEAMKTAFRELAKEKWPWLEGNGWPAYVEARSMADTTEGNGWLNWVEVFLLDEIIEAVVNEYEKERAG